MADTECVFCGGGYRYPYMLSNGEIVLLCEECSSVWGDPKNAGWGQGLNDEVLKKMYSVENVDDLFEEGSSRWLSREEINAMIDERQKRKKDAKKLIAFL